MSNGYIPFSKILNMAELVIPPDVVNKTKLFSYYFLGICANS